jgi:hypothetical protein
MNDLILNLSRFAFLFSAGTSTTAIVLSTQLQNSHYLMTAILFAIVSVIGYFFVTWVQVNDRNR